MLSNQSRAQMVFGAVGMFFLYMLIASTWADSHGSSHEVIPQSLDEEETLRDSHSGDIKPTLSRTIKPLDIDSIPASKAVALSNSLYSQPHNQTTELQRKIVSLQNQVAILEATISDLSDETLELNNELLEKDLELVALKDHIASTTQTRVVYNFVDVPIGGDVSIYSKSLSKASPAETTESITDAGNPLQDDTDISEPQNDSSFLAEEDLSDETIESLFTELKQFLAES